MNLHFMRWWVALLEKAVLEKRAARQKWNQQNQDKRREQTRRAVALWRQRHPERNRELCRQTRARNPETIKAKAARHYQKYHEREILARRAYRAARPEVGREYQRRYAKAYPEKMLARRNRPQSILAHRLRSRISTALRLQTKRPRRAESTIGCSMSEFRAYMERLFQPGMSWENYGKWEVDHIRPCSSFDLTDPAQQTECFHFSNLQPLWEKDNARKHMKVPAPEQVA